MNLSSEEKIRRRIVPKNGVGVFLFLIFTAIVIAQIVVAIRFEIISTSAIEDVKYATYCYDKGTFLISAPYMSLTGLLCRLLGMHPLSFIHLVSPVIMFPLCYGAYVFLLRRLFTDDSMVYGSAIILSIINVYGYQSELLMPYTLIGGYFTFECLLMHLIFPIGAAHLSDAIHKHQISKEASSSARYDTADTQAAGAKEEDEDYLEEWDMKKHKIINARNLAIALGIIAVILLASVFVLNNKINTLYDATVNLQNEITEIKDMQN